MIAANLSRDFLRKRGGTLLGRRRIYVSRHVAEATRKKNEEMTLIIIKKREKQDERLFFTTENGRDGRRLLFNSQSEVLFILLRLIF